MSCRHYKLLGSYLHPAHQQCPEPHPLHTDYQLLQRAGGAVTVPLATQLILNERPQEPYQHHNLHGTFQAYVLPFEKQTVSCLLSGRGYSVWLMEQNRDDLIIKSICIPGELKEGLQKTQQGNCGL